MQTKLTLCLLLAGVFIPAIAQQPPQPAPPAAVAQPAPTLPATITREMFEKRLADMKVQYDQMLANMNALDGAMQDCRFWLDQLKAAENPKSTAPAAPPAKPQTDPPGPQP